MSFQFDEPAVSPQGEVDFASHINIVMPAKKPEKKPVAERTRKVDKIALVEPPTLIQGKYVDIGANWNAMLRHRIRGEHLLDELINEAWDRLRVKHSVTRPPMCSHTLNTLWVDPDASAASADAPKRITFAEKYRETPEGTKMLSEYREHDEQVRRVNDMFIKAYLKSTECSDLYARWLDNKNPAIIVKEVYYITVTLAKSLVAGFYTDCVNYRCQELLNASTKTFDVDVDTVESLSKSIASGNRINSAYPLKQHFATKILSMLHEFAEKKSGHAGATNGTPEADKAPVDEFTVFECGINSDEVQYMSTVVAEIISRVNKGLNDKNKLTNPEAKDILFRTSRQFKRLVGCAAYDFCVKVISGICDYERNRDDSKRGFKVDVEDLSARLIQMSYDTTNQKNFATEKRAIECFIQNTEADSTTTDQYKKTLNLATLAAKTGVTVDAVKTEKQRKEAERAASDEKKAAASEGLTIEQYRTKRAANRTKRQQTSEKAQLKRTEETLEQTKKREAKLAANELKWKEKIVELKKLKDFQMVLPPSKGLKMVASA